VQSRGNPLTLQELVRHDCLTASARPGLAAWTLHGPDGAEEVKVSGRFRANSARILLKSCLAGLGVAFLPGVLVAAHLRAARLLRVLPHYRSDGAHLNVIIPSSQQIPTAVSDFVEFAAGKLQPIMSDQAPKPASKGRRR
jgi:DNA-binding transcriptional LysR family regulator